MASFGDWEEIIEETEAKHFVAREQEMNVFRNEIASSRPRYLVFYLTGQAGVGKTTLLNRYREIARASGFLLTDTDEQQRNVPSVLGRFAHQLAAYSYPLKHFDDSYKIYLEKKGEIEGDPEAPQGMAALLGRAVVRATFIAGDMVPGLRKGLDSLPREALETQAGEWAAYLAKKLKDKDELAIVQDPIPILTSLFFEDLNEIAKKQRILLCFENFEVTRQEFQDWFLRLREYKPSQNIRVAIASRDLPGAKWDSLRKVTMIVRLNVFTEQEAEVFLDAYKITNIKRRLEILEWSGRLPILMSWLAAPEGDEPDTATPTHDIVERFLRWVTEPLLRQAALLAAVPQVFNIDILKQLNLGGEGQSIDPQFVFDWLQTMPFVQQNIDGWRYHNVVRHIMLQYQRKKSPDSYRQIHTILSDFYNAKRHELYCSDEEQWANEQWRKNTLIYIYHFIIADPNMHWGEVMSLFVVAMYKRWSFAIEIIELLHLEDIWCELSEGQVNIARLFRQHLLVIENGFLKDGFTMFDKLCSISSLSPLAKCYAFAYRGECYREEKKWERALTDFDIALSHDPENAGVIIRRGLTYIQMGRYQEALADYNRAILLKENALAFLSRGATYLQMGRPQEALADFNRVIALDEKNSWAFMLRGITYFMRGYSQEALADFDRALTLDEKNTVAITLRNATYGQIRRSQEALADFDRALTLDERNTLAFILRGITYFMRGYSQEALADFDRALTLDEKNTVALALQSLIHNNMWYSQEALADFDRALTLDDENILATIKRGFAHLQMERYEEALADFDRALALDEKNAWVFMSRGAAYAEMERYEEALADFDRALALDEKNARVFMSRGAAYAEMERYEEALADFDRALALDEKNAWAFMSRGLIYLQMERYEEALADYGRALTLDEKNAWAFMSRGAAYAEMERYEEALADYGQALALDDLDFKSFMARGKIYYRTERYEEALADFDRALALDEKNAWAFMSRGAVYAKMERYEEALADYGRALALDEKNAWAFMSRGLIYLQMERYEEALADYGRALTLDEKNAWAFMSRGLIYLQMERYEEALADYGRALALDEKNAWAFARRGEIYHRIGRYEEALADYGQALALDDLDFKSFMARGKIYYRTERYEEALADFDRALALDEKNAWAFMSRGAVYAKMERYEEALADFDRALALDEKNAWAFMNRGKAYDEMERYEEALADFDRALALDEKNAWAFMNRGKAYDEMERYEEALADFDRALALDSTITDALIERRGLALSYLRRYIEAIESFEQILKNNPSSYSNLYNLAVVTVRLKGFQNSQEQVSRSRAALQAIVGTKAHGSALYGLGGLEALAGNKTSALNYLQKAILQKKKARRWARHDAAWLDLHTDPYFQHLLSEIQGLPNKKKK